MQSAKTFPYPNIVIVIDSVLQLPIVVITIMCNNHPGMGAIIHVTALNIED